MKFSVKIDIDIQELAIEYLENRRKQLPSMEAALVNKDFAALATAAHNMKGVAASYGFPELGRIGGILEKEAEAGRLPEMRALLDEIKNYIANVNLEFITVEAA